MPARVLAALVALSASAFAPAPFLEKTRKAEAARVEGLWMVTSRGGGVPPGGRTTYIQIDAKKWSFYNDDPRTAAVKPVSYHLRLKPGKPASIELRRNEADAQAYGKGVLEVAGGEMRLSYRWGETLAAPTSLDPPHNGNINFVLKRLK